MGVSESYRSSRCGFKTGVPGLGRCIRLFYRQSSDHQPLLQRLNFTQCPCASHHTIVTYRQIRVAKDTFLWFWDGSNISTDAYSVKKMV